MEVEELYNTFLKEANRLYPNSNLQSIVIDYIYGQIKDSEGAIKVFNKGFPTYNLQLLNQHTIIYNKTLNIVKKMLKSKNVEEFESKAKRRKQPNTKNFDNILGGLLNTKPPKK